MFVIVLPFIGVLIYLIGNGAGMAQRRVENSQATVTSGVTSGGTAAEIEKAKQLLDSGAITQAEFDSLKAKTLA